MLVGLMLFILTVIVVFLLTSPKTEYSNEYEELFGKFAAKTATVCLKEETNTCYSPVGLYANLMFFSELFSNDVQQQMVQSLGVESMDVLYEYYEKLQRELEIDGENSEITLVNSIWIEEGSNIDIEQLSRKVNENVYYVEDIICSDVDKWFEKKTNGVIKESGYSGLDEKVLFTNTLHYSVKWEPTFIKRINLQDFYMEDGNTIRTSFITSSIEYMKYRDEKYYLYIDVPLKEGDMLLVLPNENLSLQDIMEEKIIDEILEWYSADECEQRYIQVSLPDFSIEYSTCVKKEQCEQLGLEGLCADILQKNKINVDENGVNEDEGETVHLSYTSNEVEALKVEINRPFLYILMKDGVPLFIGTVYNPAE